MENQKKIEAYQQLFDYLYENYGFIMPQSEMDDLIKVVLQMVAKYNDSAMEEKPTSENDKALDLLGVSPCLFYIMECDKYSNWEQVSIEFDNYKDALKFKNTNYHKKTYPNSIIVALIK